MKILGKQGQKWLHFRRQWLMDNPPSHEGWYTCGICGQAVRATEVVLDHIKPRGSHPELKYDPNNIQPAHAACNSYKGSRGISSR